MPKIISQELRDTVEGMPHLKEVYFTKNGDHFFNCFENNKKSYSKSVPEFVGKFEEKSGQKVQVGTKMAQTWQADHEIVETMSRKDILAADVAAVETPEQKHAKEVALLNEKNAALEKQLAALSGGKKGKKDEVIE